MLYVISLRAVGHECAGSGENDCFRSKSTKRCLWQTTKQSVDSGHVLDWLGIVFYVPLLQDNCLQTRYAHSRAIATNLLTTFGSKVLKAVHHCTHILNLAVTVLVETVCV